MEKQRCFGDCLGAGVCGLCVGFSLAFLLFFSPFAGSQIIQSRLLLSPSLCFGTFSLKPKHALPCQNKHISLLCMLARSRWPPLYVPSLPSFVVLWPVVAALSRRFAACLGPWNGFEPVGSVQDPKPGHLPVQRSKAAPQPKASRCCCLAAPRDIPFHSIPFLFRFLFPEFLGSN